MVTKVDAKRAEEINPDDREHDAGPAKKPRLKR
jgi:hypothetical protein